MSVRVVPCCPTCRRPWPKGLTQPVDADVPVGAEVTRLGKRPGDRPGKNGGSSKGSVSTRLLGLEELHDEGELSWLTRMKQRFLRVAHTLGIIVEREVRVEVESEAARQRIAMLERRLAAAVERPGAERPHHKRTRVKVRAGARRTEGLYTTPVVVARGAQQEESLTGQPTPRRRTKRSLQEACDLLSDSHRQRTPIKVIKGEKREESL